MTSSTLFWHDYETFGIDPRRDKPAQFAGIRTDLDLNIIGDPVSVYCIPPDDYLPDPEACLLTGISPQVAETNGVVEAEFCRIVHEEFAQPNTCGLGYNTLRFDDEFTRNCLYRNFYDPYAREWQNGNSRWDLIDVVRATKALRPNGINWPVDAEGRPSFKLEELTAANGIQHEAAHDALSDVYATIGVAKLIRSAQPKLFDYLWRNKTKDGALNLLQLGRLQPVVHVSGRYAAIRHCLAVVLPICKHPFNNNGIIVYDLSVDPFPLLSLSADEIRLRLFTPTDDLPDGVERIPLKTVLVNKCPVLAPINVLTAADLQRLNIDLGVCYENIDRIRSGKGLVEKMATVFSQINMDKKDEDPELCLYSGGFYNDRDKQMMTKIRSLCPSDLAKFSPKFNDSRFNELFFRYKARNFPNALSVDENIRWRTFCRERITGQTPGSTLSLENYLNKIKSLRTEHPNLEAFLDDLENYAERKIRECN